LDNQDYRSILKRIGIVLVPCFAPLYVISDGHYLLVMASDGQETSP
jgi:hypothetical protein